MKPLVLEITAVSSLKRVSDDKVQLKTSTSSNSLFQRIGSRLKTPRRCTTLNKFQASFSPQVMKLQLREKSGCTDFETTPLSYVSRVIFYLSRGYLVSGQKIDLDRDLKSWGMFEKPTSNVNFVSALRDC
ncbi:hypothetical protein J7T55_011465 [Diaporthe amygdali]|uniref:uncharacterized protein n=1 Tax=Phomopsis amygdali TaxID=1214568 RepID=UPI0022FE6E54|nr:uncharacterized protein J7T55_011465 [Diaporthe amygdali]KAJ0123004.1 hypothetical protein J7T55_011465 [Diaporthe amygdali]